MCFTLHFTFFFSFLLKFQFYRSKHSFSLQYSDNSDNTNNKNCNNENNNNNKIAILKLKYFDLGLMLHSHIKQNIKCKTYRT